MRTWVRVLFCAALFGSSVFMAVQSGDAGGKGSPVDGRFLVAAAIVAIAGVVQTYTAVEQKLGGNRSKVSAQVSTLLRIELLKIHRQELIDTDIMSVSLHVWEVPVWYRTIFPYRFRQLLRRMASPTMQRRRSLRPRLHRVAGDRLDPLAGLDIPFRKGVGLVGMSLESKENEFVGVDFGASEFERALESDANWKRASEEITRHLSRENASALAKRYGQAMALAVRGADSEPIGCVTIEFPPHAADRLSSRVDLQNVLQSLAASLSPILAI